MISEVLLQQTVAERVSEPYKRIIKRYPDFKSLAGADIDFLDKNIQPLGLHYRSELIIKIAKTVIEKYQTFPEDEKKIKSLPGVGDYIGDVILCHVFNKKKLPIDTNVYRLICRYIGIQYPPKIKKYKEKAHKEASLLVDNTDKPPDLHYSILDFTAKVCTYYNPKCQECIFKKNCEYAKSRN